jgi:hypothetical protein
VNYRDSAEESVARIEKLFNEAEVFKTTEKIKLRAAERALAMKAPFDRQRNGMGDAVLVETYAEIAKDGRSLCARHAQYKGLQCGRCR